MKCNGKITFILILVIWCIANAGVSFNGSTIFGINAKLWTPKEMISYLKSNQAKFKKVNSEIDFIIESNCFIGVGIEKKSIKRIMYVFPDIGDIYLDIEIEFDNVYLDNLLKILKEEYGFNITKQNNTNDYTWEIKRVANNNIYLSSISINTHDSLYFYKDLGYRKDKDAFYMLIRWCHNLKSHE